MYILYFIIYSFIGWILDTGYRSLLVKEFAPNAVTIFPFTPIYGFGALLILLIYPAIQHLNVFLQFLLFAVILTLLEYLGGVLTLHFLGRRLWDYSYMPLNFQGHISLLHALFWGALALLFVTYIHPPIQQTIQSFFLNRT